MAGAGVEGMIGVDGTIAARVSSPALHFRLTDAQTGLTAQPTTKTVTQSLRDGYLPLVTTVWTLPRWVVTWTTFAESTGPNPIAPGPRDSVVAVVLVQIHRLTGSGAATFDAEIGPENPAGAVTMTDIQADATTVIANKGVALVASHPANRTVDAREIGPGSAAGGLADGIDVNPGGKPDGYLEYDLGSADSPDTFLSFALPMTDPSGVATLKSTLAACAAASCPDQVATAWRQTLHRVEVVLPDHEVSNAYYASLAYLLMAQSNAGLFSGSAGQRSTWVRDSAYGTQALAVAGHADAARSILSVLQAGQQPSGREAPIINADNRPLLPLKSEWDAQGEYIVAVVEYARVTRDLAFLRAMYPSLRQAAEFQRHLLTQTRVDTVPPTPFYGLLPAGESAEDLYNADWHHYWDDFWAIDGFHEVADSAQQLGAAGDVALYQREEATLRGNVLIHVAATRSSDGIPYISNGPEDAGSTAMARGATPAVWPLPALDGKSALVQHSFEYYYRQMIAPRGGAYLHYGENDWPYAGLGLAHAFYNLGMVDHTWQILDWTLAHQTAPHLYAWGEAVNPQNFSLASGDSPHTWMEAELILLVRDILLREDGQQLDVGPFPESWLAPGATLSIGQAPTAFGEVGYALTRSGDGHTVKIALDGAAPPGGYQIELPASLQATTLVVDGGPASPIAGSRIALPTTARAATITLRNTANH